MVYLCKFNARLQNVMNIFYAAAKISLEFVPVVRMKKLP